MIEVAGCDRFRMEIYGEHGVALAAHRARPPRRRSRRAGRRNLAGANRSTRRRSGRRQHDAWLAGVAGDAPPLDTAADALRGMRVVEAVMRSHARGGATVEVAEAIGASTA